MFGVIREGTLTHDGELHGRRLSDRRPGHRRQRADNVHIGRNLGPVPLVLWVDYIQPAGTPLSVDAPDPGCGFA